MSKHTPGPWQFTPSDPAEGYECYWVTATPAPNQERELATVSGPQNDRNGANARLIAAAPILADFALHQQWRVVMGALDKWISQGGSDLVALGIISSGLLTLDEVRRASLAKATESVSAERDRHAASTASGVTPNSPDQRR